MENVNVNVEWKKQMQDLFLFHLDFSCDPEFTLFHTIFGKFILTESDVLDILITLKCSNPQPLRTEETGKLCLVALYHEF